MSSATCCPSTGPALPALIAPPRPAGARLRERLGEAMRPVRAALAAWRARRAARALCRGLARLPAQTLRDIGLEGCAAARQPTLPRADWERGLWR